MEFKRAKLKLTLLYSLIIMAITISFSSIIYLSVVNTTKRVLDQRQRRFESRMRVIDPKYGDITPLVFEQLDEEALANVRERLILTLGTLNIFIMIGSGIIGYLFSGHALEPIEIMHKKQKKFVSDAAHEIRTPLTAIRTETEVTLRDKKIDLSKAQNQLESNLEEVSKLENLSNSLLLDSKYGESRNFSREEVNLLKLVAEVTKKLTPLAEKNRVQIQNLPIDKDLYLFGNKQMLTQLLTIFVDNAIKYNNANGEVSVSAYKRDKKIILEIKDTGVGIDQKDQDRIFDRFYRVENSRNKDSTPGFGLGLSIASHIISFHDADIDVESSVGKGTLFRISFPA